MQLLRAELPIRLRGGVEGYRAGGRRFNALAEFFHKKAEQATLLETP